MPSQAQTTANLANAQHSTGPRTEAGKAASSQNALKHGLTAASVLLPGEDQEAYRRMCEGMFERFAPACTPERELVQLLCDTQWRLNRCARLETVILSADQPDLKAFDILSRHEARLKKCYSNTLKEARDLIHIRRNYEDAQMKEAMLIRRAARLKGDETSLQEIGFVFSTAQVDAAILREDRLAAARDDLAFDAMARRASISRR